MSPPSDEHDPGSQTLIFPFIAVICGLLLDEVNKKMRSININVPDSVFQFGAALIASACICWCLPASTVSAIDRMTWTDLAPDTVLTILLPPLIFESSFKINSHTFFAKITHIVLLTVFLYAFSLGIAGGLLLPLMHHVNLSAYSTVFLFLSIIVATDPVAVVAILEQYGAPHRLRIMIEGESLLNDGLALTCYRILTEFLKWETGATSDIDITDLVLGFVMCIVVTPIVAMLLAWTSAWFVSKLDSQKARQGFIIVAVYGLFMLFDHMKGSSALGLVFYGVTLSYYKEEMPPDTTEQVLQLWQTLGYCANNVIFIFSGFVIARETFSAVEQGVFLQIERHDLFVLLEGVAIFCFPLFARVLSTVFFYCLYDLFRKREKKPLPKSDYVILSYAGLRGALGLILSLELGKIQTLHDHRDQTKVILLLTCSTTVACLVIQGMTFSSVAKKEGTTKRSRYTREMNKRLSKNFKSSLDKNLNMMKKQHTAYLHGTNWTTVSETVREVLRVHEKQMDEEVKKLGDDDFDEDDLWEGIIDEDEDDHDLRVKKRDATDAKIGLYGILLAKVRESWRCGEVSGQTAHVIISMLEHGIDEGTITVNDMREYLTRVDSFPIFRFLVTAANGLNSWLRQNEWIVVTGGMAGNPLFHSTDTPDRLMDRSFEKWWLLHTIFVLGYTTCLSVVTFSPSNVLSQAGFVAHLLYIPFCFSTAMESGYMLRLMMRRQKDAKNHGIEPGKDARMQWITEVIMTSINTAAVAIGTILMCVLQFVDGRFCNNNRNSDLCIVLSYLAWALMLLSTLYRLLRTFPLTIILSREHFLLRAQRSERVRLSILIYLTYFMKNADFPKELFKETVYKVVRREAREFTRIIDANLRNELKQHATELGLISVVKSRQAIRMMSHQLKGRLEEMRLKGFTPEDVEDRWDGIVAEIRRTADKMLTVPDLDYDAWLERLPWFNGLQEANSRRLKNLIVQELINKTPEAFYSGQHIQLHDRKMIYVKKGICKVTEGISQENSHEFYVHQGEIMGPRNMMLVHMRQRPPEKRYWTPMLPHRRWVATTYVEVCYLEADLMMKMLEIPDVYKVIARYIQIKRIVAEVRHHYASSDLTQNNFMSYVEQKKGEIVTAEKLVRVKERQMAIVGCWTALNAVKAMDSRSLYQVIDSNRHIIGPAWIVLAPVNEHCEGMVYFVNQKIDRRFQSRKTARSMSRESEEKSNYSIIQDGRTSVIKKRAPAKSSKSLSAQ